MHDGGDRIYRLHVIIHNGLFAECEVLDNFRGLCCPRTRTRTCKLILEDPRGQGLSSRTTTLDLTSAKFVKIFRPRCVCLLSRTNASFSIVIVVVKYTVANAAAAACCGVVCDCVREH